MIVRLPRSYVCGIFLFASLAATFTATWAADIPAAQCTLSNIQAGYHLSCGQVNGGGIACFGENAQGEVGNGTTTQVESPTEVLTAASTPLVGVANFSARHQHVCALMNDSTLRCWGNNANGQLGNGDVLRQNFATTVINSDTTVFDNVRQVSVGVNYTCAVRQDDTLWCWGSRFNGKLGVGSPTSGSELFPVQVSLPLGAKRVFAGRNHTCAVLTDDGLWCWGLNDNGQLGNSTTLLNDTPVQVLSSVGPTVNFGAVASAVIGDRSTCALQTNGSVWCWGRNIRGQLGDGTTTNKVLPVRVLTAISVAANLPDASAIAGTQVDVSDSTSFCALIPFDGTVRCWGDNAAHYSLGTNNPGLPYSAVAVIVQTSNNTTYHPAISISGGYDHFVSQLSDGSWWAWGHYFGAQTGNNTVFANIAAPTHILCSECQSDSDCAGNTHGPVCDGFKHTCGQCTSTNVTQCPIGNNSCVTTPPNNICNQCSTDAQCSGTTPHCTSSSACVECVNNTQCPGTKPLCTQSNTCVQCLSNNDCNGATPYCNLLNNSCQPCITDGAPSCSNAAAPACNVGNSLAGRCTQCTSTNTSLCAGAAASCDVTTGTCVGCNGNFGSGATRPCSNASSPACSNIATCIAFPDTTIVSSPPSSTSATSALFDFNSPGNASASFECSVDGSVFSSCITPKIFGGFVPGNHHFAVRAVVLGVADPSPATYDWTTTGIPLTWPGILTPANHSSTSNTSVPFFGTATPNSTVNLFIDGSLVATVPADSSGNWGWTPSTPFAEGVHVAKANATLGSNTSADCPATIFTVDTTDPDTQISVHPPAIAGGNLAHFEFSSSEANVTYECELDAQTSFTHCAQSSNFGNLSNGPHTIHVRAVDQAKNVDPTPATYAWTINALYVPTITSPTNHSLLSNPLVKITGTAGPNATVDLRIDDSDSLIIHLVADANGMWTYTSDMPFEEGAHTLVASNTDGTSPVVYFVVDTTAPETSFGQLPSLVEHVATATIEILSSEMNSTFVCGLDGASPTPCPSHVVLSGLADGPHTFQAQAIDAAGNIDESPASYSWQVTTDLPVALTAPVIINPTPEALVDNPPTVDGLGPIGGTVTVTLDGVALCTTNVDATGHFSCSPAGFLSGGPHDVHATADKNGIHSSASANIHFYVKKLKLAGHGLMGCSAAGQESTWLLLLAIVAFSRRALKYR